MDVLLAQAQAVVAPRLNFYEIGQCRLNVVLRKKKSWFMSYTKAFSFSRIFIRIVHHK